jgi:hypothetical protein
MEEIIGRQGLEARYQRLRKVIERLEKREQQFEAEVLLKFDTLDIEGIEKLLKERQKNQNLQEMLQRFLDYYEHKQC